MPFSQCDALKARLDALRPIEQRHFAKIQAYWQVGLTYSSNALEGSTLTESETKVILEDGLTVSGKPLREHIEAVGHRDALGFLFLIYLTPRKTPPSVEHAVFAQGGDESGGISNNLGDYSGLA